VRLFMAGGYRASILYVKIVKQYAEANGINASEIESALRQGAFLNASSQKNAYEHLVNDEIHGNKKFPLVDILDFWERIATSCSDVAFGLNVGKECHVTTYGIFAHVLMNCPNLYDALELVSRYGFMLNEALGSTFTSFNGEVTYKLDCLIDHPAAYHYVEFHFASILKLGSEIAARKERDNIHMSRVEFCHSAKAPMHVYERIFKSEVLFEQSSNRLVMPHKMLMIPTHSPNRGLYNHLLCQVDSIVRAETNHDCYTRKIFEFLASKDEWLTWPSLDESACAIGVSASTLKRKLKLEESTYQAVCDQVRYKWAKRLLASEQQSVTEIAYSLGFSSTAAFSRAFKRWSGKPPSEYVSA